MKHLIKPLLLSILLFNPFISSSQSVFIVRHFNNDLNKEQKVCPVDIDALTTASEEMFTAGNPNYIIVDLIADGYISLTDSFEYSINLKLSEPPFLDAKYALKIPANAQENYVHKFEYFLKTSGLSRSRYEGKTGSISFTNNITQEDIINTKSEFRTGFTTLSLKQLGFYYNEDIGRLRIYEELIKDNLAPLDKALQLNFSKNGFYVHSKRLTPAQREKYSTMCKEMFGNNYYTDQSSWKVGSLPEDTIEKQITELKEKLAAK